VVSLPPSVRVFVALSPLDMRGSFDVFAGAVRRLGLDPVDGHLYLFVSAARAPSSKAHGLTAGFVHGRRSNVEAPDGGVAGERPHGEGVRRPWRVRARDVDLVGRRRDVVRAADTQLVKLCR
jgi:hypothetical protein